MFKQRIHEQKLDGNLEDATARAVWVWKEGETAYKIDFGARPFQFTINKVQFTGKHWLAGNRWNYDKIYEYHMLDATDSYHLDKMHKGEVSWTNENLFHETVESAMSKIRVWDNNQLEDLKKDREKNHVILENFLSKHTRVKIQTSSSDI